MNSRYTQIISFCSAPEDKNTYNLEDQFMWGDGLLIVPGLQEVCYVELKT